MCFRLRCKSGHGNRRDQSSSTVDGAGTIFLQDTCSTVRCHEGDTVQVLLNKIFIATNLRTESDMFEYCTSHNIIKDVCCQLGIPPMARVFFALCSRGSGLPLNPHCTLSKKESRNQYQLRVFVNIANSWYLKQISAAAYDYYYQQLCSDFINDRLQPYVTINSAVWMTAITMAKEAKASGRNFETLMSNRAQYMPKFLHKRFQRDCKVRKKLKELFDQFHNLNVDSSHYVSKFLEVYEKDKMCGHHLFPLKLSRMSLLRIETEHVVISWKEGIYKIVIGDQKTSHELMCSLMDISTLTANLASCQIVITKTDNTEAQLCFTNVKDLVGFSVIVQTYWRLKVDGSHIIFRGDIASPDGRLYHLSLAKNNDSPLCHAPITEDAAEKILKEHFAEGNFLIRESRTADNAYTLSLCHDKQILRYRIICHLDGTYSFKDEDSNCNEDQGKQQQCRDTYCERFSTLHDLIKSHKQKADGLPTLLSSNISPDVAGKVPLLPPWNYSESEATQPVSTAVSLPPSDTAHSHSIMWSRSLAGLRCRFCQQRCGNEFVHLCDDCDHNYCIHCVKDLPSSQWFCYDCKPILPREQAQRDTATDFKGGDKGDGREQESELKEKNKL